jgi:hypothetical protein
LIKSVDNLPNRFEREKEKDVLLRYGYLKKDTMCIDSVGGIFPAGSVHFFCVSGDDAV